MNNLKLSWLSIILFVPFISFANNVNAKTPPNVIIILADDLGYGDLSCFGHPTIRTPNLDQMAAEGMRFTQFYSAANVCTPSRAALLTGRLPIRIGLAGNPTEVFFPNSLNGLPETEITIASKLKSRGYTTGIIGKWHLGHLPQYLPVKHGFDYYFGIPYSNDMIPSPRNTYPPLPLYKDSKIIEENPDQRQLTQRYTEESIAFIKQNKKKPFFLYYANNFPHVPLFASDKFKGKSKRGLFGDVVAELDWSVGQILKTLKEQKLDKNTLVFFTSDNGPWLITKEAGGSAGLLFEGKGSAYEGGMRVPAIAWWPGTISANQVNAALATTMDLFPTIINMADAQMPGDRIFDGMDMMPLLTGIKESVRNEIFYYKMNKLYAIRKGPWKAHFTTRPSYSKEAAVDHDPALLYNLDIDPSEKYNIAADHPDILAEIKQVLEKHTANISAVPSLLEARSQK